MAKDVKQKVSRIKVKKKNWYRILSSRIFGEKEIGETYLSSPESALGRTMKINLKDLTGNIKDQKIYISFTIDKVEGSILRTSATGYELTPTSVKRMVRKSTDRLDDYFVFRSKDGKEVVAKTLVITMFPTQRSVQKEIRKQFKDIIKDEISKNTYDAFINNLVTRKVQNAARKILQKIYPLKEVALRVVALKSSSAEGESAPENQAESPAVEEPAAIQQEEAS